MLLGFNLCGLSLFYLAEIQLCKIRAREYADGGHTSTEKNFVLFFSNTKGIKLVDDDEICAGGKMYDIVKTTRSRGITCYYTLSDKDEDDGIRHLTALENGNWGEKSLSGRSLKLYEEKYFPAISYHHGLNEPADREPRAGTVNEAFFYPSIFKDIFSPPPDHLLS